MKKFGISGKRPETSCFLKGRSTSDKLCANIRLWFLVTAALILYSVNAPAEAMNSTINNNAETFTLIILPDSQHLSDEYPWSKMGFAGNYQVFESQIKWIVKEKENLNIAYVLHEGDLVNGEGGTTSLAMEHPSKCFTWLDEEQIPYAIALGNHDYTDKHKRESETFHKYFPVKRFSKWPTFGGVKDRGKMDNNYHLFTAGGEKWMILVLEYGPRSETLDWANDIAKQYSDRKVIVLTHTHTFLDNTLQGSSVEHHSLPTTEGFPGALTGEQVWKEFVKKHENIKFVLSGHICMNRDTGGARVLDEDGNDLRGENGNVVVQLLANYQAWKTWYPDGTFKTDTGYLRIMQFDLEQNIVTVKSYSPYKNKYLTNSAHCFEIRNFIRQQSR
jgi:calcineurin-like phosphoesterase family protein